MNIDRKIRVLVSKVGPDGRDRGVRVLAYGLRDSGFEVIFLGSNHTPEQIVTAAVQEDVDAVGLSLSSSTHLELIKKVIEALKKTGGGHMAILVEGPMREQDEAQLKEMGVLGVLAPGACIEQAAQMINVHMTSIMTHN